MGRLKRESDEVGAETRREDEKERRSGSAGWIPIFKKHFPKRKGAER
jgi:hypothetical protein